MGNKKKFKLKSIIILVIMGFVFYTFGEQMIKSYQMQKEVNTLVNQISQLQHKNGQLTQVVKNLDSDAYVEKVAREKLGLVRQGEKVIIRAKPGNVAPIQKGNTDFLRD